jgi:hypothetical protein
MKNENEEEKNTLEIALFLSNLANYGNYSQEGNLSARVL